MKHSGIEWIGDIPSDWKVKKIKYLSNLKGRIGWQGLTSDEYTDEGAYLITGTDFDNGNIKWDSCVHVSMKRWAEAKDIQVKNGDLLITKDGTVGKVAIVKGLNGYASLNSGVLLISTYAGFDREFLYWVLLSDVFLTWFSNKNAGNSTIIHLYQNDFAEFKYPMPVIAEQHAIAAFLDTQCSKIDSIVAELEQQIEILKQYKTSLITETVTKGLNNNVPLKNSGINWIGKIPDHWEVKRLKYLTINANTGESISKEFWDPDGDYLLYTAGQFPIRSTFNEFPKNIMTSENDILVARNGAGAVQIPQLGSIYTDHVIRFTIKMRSSLKYIYYTLLLGMEKIVSEAIDVSLKTLSRSDWDNLSLPFPTLSEQQAIAAFLDNKCKEITDIITEKQQSIDTMKAYKISLIYEYVTGKKRVKGYS